MIRHYMVVFVSTVRTSTLFSSDLCVCYVINIVPS